MAGTAHVHVVAMGPIASASLVWKHRGQTYATLVAKATFRMVHGDFATLVAPAAVVTKEQHHRQNPMRSVRATSEIAPFLRRADVILVGHACAPAGTLQDEVNVRLRVASDTVLLDKAVVVRGELRKGADAREPFDKLPLTYENALGGVGWKENPLGVGALGERIDDREAPRILPPDRSMRTIGFGPIARSWPARTLHLGKLDRAIVSAPVPDLPHDFDWDYFHAAPPDQRIGLLRGDEVIAVNGAHPDLQEIVTQLPEVRVIGIAKGIVTQAPEAERPLQFQADTLYVDTDALRVHVVWRCAIPVRDEAHVGDIRVTLQLVVGGAIVAGEAHEDLRDDAAAQTAEPREGTVALADEHPLAGTLPWAKKPKTHPSVQLEEATSRFGDAPEPAAPSVADLLDAARTAAREDGARTTIVGDAPEPKSAWPFAKRPVPKTPAIGGQIADVPGAPWSPDTPAARLPKPPRTADRTLDAGDAAEPIPASVVVAAPVALTFEPRNQDTIPVFGPAQLAGLAFTWKRKPTEDVLTIVVKATCDLAPSGPAVLRSEPDPIRGDAHVGDDLQGSVIHPSDLAPFKPRADVVLSGHAHAPRGRGVAAEVRFRFGKSGAGFDRKIAVFGPRSWQSAGVRIAPGEPAPFDKVPLVFERAFGGPENPKNPVGLGSSELLPQLEDPAALIVAPGDTPEPVAFCAIPPLWPIRWSLLGTFDASWQKRRWPYFPEDLSWSFFQAAPPSQRLDLVNGDEPFELTGMSAEHPKMAGALPGVKPRCFLQRSEESKNAFHEVLLRLDTVAFDADLQRVSLVWRGLAPVRDDDASDVTAVVLELEKAGDAPIVQEEARGRWLAQEALRREKKPKLPAEIAANDAEAAPSPTAEERLRRTELAAAGFAVSVAALPAESGGAPSAEAPAPAPLPEIPPGASASETLRKKAEAAFRAGASLEGVDLTGADLSDLDLSGIDLRRADLRYATFARSKLVGARLDGAQIGGADLLDADLTSASLERADLTGACLDRAILDGAQIGGALFSGVSGDRASFRRARGDRPTFERGIWTGAHFEEAALTDADFTGAILDHAVLDGAELVAIRLYDATGTRPSFRGARMSGARADGAKLPKAVLDDVSAPESVWDRAVLDDSAWTGATLTGAGFARAQCLRAKFSGADLAQSRFRRAKAAGASFLKANLMEAQLEAADLTNADLRGANLFGAETWRMKIGGANLEHANVSGTKLEGGRT